MTEHRESHYLHGGQIRGAHPDTVLRDLSARQHGVVTRRQLVAAGLTARMIDKRTADGPLVPVHRAVYAVGHDRLRREGWWLAAALAIGPGAVLSHRSAAALHEIRFSNGALIDVSTGAERRSPRGIRVHGRRTLDAADVTIVDDIPVTTVARTLVDLADVLAHDHLAKTLSEVERRGKLDLTAIQDALARTRGRHGPGPARMRAALEDLAALGATLTHSELEDRFVALLDRLRRALARPPPYPSA